MCVVGRVGNQAADFNSLTRVYYFPDPSVVYDADDVLK